MNLLLEYREKLIKLFNEYDLFVVPVLKFALAFVLFYLTNSYYGYLEALNSIFIIFILAIVCAMIPLSGTVVVGIALLILNCFGISFEIGLLAFCLYILLLILILRFVSEDSLAVLISPFAFSFNIPGVIPISLGLAGSAASALTSVCAVVAFSFTRNLPEIKELVDLGDLSSLEIIKQAMDMLFSNAEMIISIIVFAAVTMAVHSTRKLLSTYGWSTAILVGSVLYIFLMIIGNIFLELNMSYVVIIFGTLCSAAISFVISFFLFNVNYEESRYIQFEDDDYYYYVKAIPKTKITDAEPAHEEQSAEV